MKLTKPDRSDRSGGGSDIQDVLQGIQLRLKDPADLGTDFVKSGFPHGAPQGDRPGDAARGLVAPLDRACLDSRRTPRELKRSVEVLGRRLGTRPVQHRDELTPRLGLFPPRQAASGTKD